MSVGDADDDLLKERTVAWVRQELGNEEAVELENKLLLTDQAGTIRDEFRDEVIKYLVKTDRAGAPFQDLLVPGLDQSWSKAEKG